MSQFLNSYQGLLIPPGQSRDSTKTQIRGYKKGCGWKAHGFIRGMQNPRRPKGG